MRRRVCLLLLSSLALLGGCTQPATNEQSATTNRTAAASPAPGQTNAGPTATPTTPAPKGDVDPCSLLTSAELQAVQGEPLKETKASAQAAGGLLNLQCFYTLPTFSNSVSLTVTEKDPTAAAGRTAKQFWEDNFGEWEKGERGSGKEQREKGRGEKTKESGEKEKERGGREAGGREEEEERGAPPVRVPGLGDEAFWSANRVGGALYVLKGERFFMLSVGGKGDGDEKLKKAKALARDALRHL